MLTILLFSEVTSIRLGLSRRAVEERQSKLISLISTATAEAKGNDNN